MDLKALILTCLASGILAQSQSCWDHECTCQDVSGGVCTQPGAASEIHVGTIEECIENCDLFNSFGMCDWIMFYPSAQNPGVDENCRMIIDATESMEDYLGTCRYVGQPLFHKPTLGGDGVITGECMPNAIEGVGTGTCAPVPMCSGNCHGCSGTNCAGYAEADCTFTDDPNGESQAITSYDACFAFCSLNAQTGAPDVNNFAYLKFDKESQICNCETKGHKQCTIQIVKHGVTADDIATCSDDGPDPTGCTSDADCLDASQPKCDAASGVCVQCISDSDCPNPAGDPTENLCSLVSHTCMTGCRTDEDCESQDYCKKASHNDEIGSCTLGCRNPGQPCTLEPGTCSGTHTCEEGGSVYINGLEVYTASCVGCSSRELAGASITLTAVVPGATGEGTCSTSVLDVPSRTDYPSGGGNVVFDQPETLDTCYLFHSENEVTSFSVSWSGLGTWTPDKFIINWHENTPRCCQNTGGTTLTDGVSASFSCERCN
jgi:hypothetical protein